MNSTNILLRHNFVSIPAGKSLVGNEAIATILMNLSYYGYGLSVDAYKSLLTLGPIELAAWWSDIETELKVLSGANLKMGGFVVYKNFPAEVLEKTEAEYWIPQILMYWGFDKSYFTQPVKPRAKMSEQPKCRVLRLAKKNTEKDILGSLCASAARWKDEEFQDVLFLSQELPINFAKLAFKENLVKVATHFMSSGRKIKIDTATDVLRLAAGLSDGDVALREKFKFRSFKKPERRYLLSTLEQCDNLAEDVARRPELWKRFFHNLHAGDYAKAYPRVCEIADQLYRGQTCTFNALIERLILQKDSSVLHVLTARPGDFRRRLVHMLDLFGDKAAEAFVADAVISKLTTHQVVSLRTYLETVNSRYHRCFPPKGNWTKLQIGEARWVLEKHVSLISDALGKALAKRLPLIKKLDDAASMIKLPSNDGEVSPYNRGTVFPIPKDVEFIRTASYWQNTKGGVTWFDNGWNFFDQNWKSLGACCWNMATFPSLGWRAVAKDSGAVFSGDPINTTEMKGRAAQLIDLYPQKLKAQGVRYAVWNILCYSRLAFSAVEDVFAALQWGKDPQKGKLFEPSRCQLQLPLKGDSMTKYVCVIDLETMEMIYIDANLHGNTSSAESNSKSLEANMPAFMEYIKSLPSVHDLFRESVDTRTGRCISDIHVLYSDKDTDIKDGTAYVFRPENKTNTYKSLDINSLL